MSRIQIKEYTRDELNSMRCLGCDVPVSSWTLNTPVNDNITYEAEFCCGCKVKSTNLDHYLPAKIKNLATEKQKEMPEQGYVGKKYDDNKPRYHLMPRLAESEIVDVLTYGAIKYDEHNWQRVTPLNDRYYSAARRHMQAFMSGEQRDHESGKHHLAHAACCILFMLENDLQNETPEILKRQAD